MRRAIILVLFATLILITTQTSPVLTSDIAILRDSFGPNSINLSAADSSETCQISPYIILQLTFGDVQARGDMWSGLLSSRGIKNTLLHVSDVISNSSLIAGAPAILLDGSLGSSNGNLVSQLMIDILIQEDTSLILTGRSAWLLHRLTGRVPPSLTAPIEKTLITLPEHSGAVFLSRPQSLTAGLPLTSESELMLPIDQGQTEMSRLVNLTGCMNSIMVSPLRHDSWPLDIFMFAPENPAFLTENGQALLENVVSFCTAIRESSIALELSNLQSPEGSLLAGGMSYMHEPSLSSTYYAVRTMKSLLISTEWSSWVSMNVPLVNNILNTLFVDYGSESGFMASVMDATVDCRSTAQGLWLVTVMGLDAQFSVTEIVAYLSARQSADGGFENYITSTYHVVEALWISGQLTAIDTYQLESWLRSLVIDGAKTSNPDYWGAIGSNPASISPLNNYATEYLRSLSYVGKAHSDPVKLTNWIRTRTSNGDGSFRNAFGLDEEVVTGTASALSSMQILGTLSDQNRTSGLNWLSKNQLSSGGFGLKVSSLDLVGKTRETSRVALCLNALSETTGLLASRIVDYVESITTEVGFEAMDMLPSIMWTSWLLDTSRLSHASQSVNLNLARDYITYFSEPSALTIYPFWNNLTTMSSPEYSVSQYRTKSVWTQYFGLTAAQALGIVPASSVISDVLLYLSQSQHISGHYRPTPLMGAAHMQYSVAAVESLYILGKMSTIPYRANLEAAILSMYDSGCWNSDGWTLKPFVGSQQAIDYLSTRAAIRLGVLSTSMASEIASNIDARLQYSDLLALSWDVATLSLLQASSFSATLESMDTSLILSALSSSHFADGWFNTSYLWQPVYTAVVLKMVSILGLRCLLSDISGVSVSSSANATAQLGDLFNISITITSTLASHCIIVYAFDQALIFNEVATSDILHFLIPNNRQFLGSNKITLMVSDWGYARAFNALEVEVEGSLNGNLTLTTTALKIGEKLNGTASWTLSGGVDASLAHVSILIGDSLEYQQWSYDTFSPFVFSLPTNEYTAGIYSLTVTITVPYCMPLILDDEVLIAEPDPTYLITPLETYGTVGEELTIYWLLCYIENSTSIGNQEVTLIIRDITDSIVFTDVLISSAIQNVFLWTPETNGEYEYLLRFDGNGTLDKSYAEGHIYVYEETVLSWICASTIDQYSTANLIVLLETGMGETLIEQPIHIIVTAPSSVTVIDGWYITDSTGRANIALLVLQNGVYLLQAQYSANGFFESSYAMGSLISWSSSSLELGGADFEESIGCNLRLWAQLDDLTSQPVQGHQVLLRIILLPSTVLIEQVLTTNSSGYVSMQWIAGSAGAYRFEAIYSGTISRASAISSIDFAILIPITLTLSTASSTEVGIEVLIHLIATDHHGEQVSGITVALTILGPRGIVLYSNVSTINGGLLTYHWISSERGMNEITVLSTQQSWYHASLSSVTIDVYETPTVEIEIPMNAIAPMASTINVSLIDIEGIPIQNASIRIQIWLDTTIIVDKNQVTDAYGYVSIFVSLAVPGPLQVEVTLSSQGWLLGTNASSCSVVTAATTLVIVVPGYPVEQGSTVGIVVFLTDFSGTALVGASIQIDIAWSNGTVFRSVNRITDGVGRCTLAQTFNSEGDFIIRASYGGYGLNSSSSHIIPQRVFINPLIDVIHEPSYIIGDAIEFHVSLLDTFGSQIPGRPLRFIIELSGSIVFEWQFESGSIPSKITWYPSERGFVTITIVHQENAYYLFASKVTTVSIMELVNGVLVLTPDVLDLFGSTIISYYLDAAGSREGIRIQFQVLGMDLVPVWASEGFTNSSGIASVVYVATESHGVLRVKAGPAADELLIGGDVQEQLIVKTLCHITVSLEPAPPSVNTSTTIVIYVIDSLGGAVDGPTVTVSLYNPYGEIVKLGAWTNSVTVTIVNGLATASFIPGMVGLYTVVLTSAGSVSVHAFSSTTHHTIYSTTKMQLVASTYELEVGQALHITTRLLDHNGLPLVGRNIFLYLDGPGTSSVGPVILVTNSTGYVYWVVAIGDEGSWVLSASFSGLGVYLPASAAAEIHVSYGTIILLSLTTTIDIVAGQNEASFSIHLTDTEGTPLEGFSVHYEIYHETLGLVFWGNIIQTDSTPIRLTLAFERMGVHTIIVSFSGTSHYHSSNAGLQFIALGTTEVASTTDNRIDRSFEPPIAIMILDEVSLPIPLNDVDITISLEGSSGTVDISSRLLWTESQMRLYTNGLSVGHYCLNITVLDTSMRLGCNRQIEFDITSTTVLIVTETALSGILSESHIIRFLLVDSLDEAVHAADIWVSLYDPLGREIYGNPLTTRTLLFSSVSGTQVSWTPTLVGEYRFVFIFEGNEFLISTSLEINILVRHTSSFSLDAPLQSEFGLAIPISITLRGALGGISGATISLVVLMNNEIEQKLNLTTGSRGIVSTSLANLFAGYHIIMITFSGSSTQAPCSINLTLSVSPLVVIDFNQVGEFYIGHNCSLALAVSILGALPLWNGSLEAVLFSPNGQILTMWNFELYPYSVMTLAFLPHAEGTYLLNLTIIGLPVTSKGIYSFAVAAVHEPLFIYLDVETTPMFGGLGVIALVGLVLRKKMKRMLESMVSEWQE